MRTLYVLKRLLCQTYCYPMMYIRRTGETLILSFDTFLFYDRVMLCKQESGEPLSPSRPIDWPLVQ